MHDAIIIFQVLLIIVGLVSMIMLTKIRTTVASIYLLLLSVCITIYSAGYFLELTGYSKESLLTAYSVEYMGVAFCAFCYAVFIFSYCKLKMPAAFWWTNFFFDVFVLFLVYMGEKTTFYYTSIEYDGSGLFPRLVTAKGPVYYIFVAQEVILLVASSVALLRRRREVSKVLEKQRLLNLFIVSLLPFFGLFVGSGFTGGYDCNPLTFTVVIASITVYLGRGHMFDIVNVANQAMFDTKSAAIIVLDSNKCFVEANEKAIEIFPDFKDFIVGSSISSIDVNFFSDAEAIFMRDDRSYETSLDVLYSKEHVVGYLIHIHDITELHKQMQMMRQLKEEADQASEAKGSFLANMSHEIRTPLNAIIGMSELADKETDENVIRDYVSQIQSSGKMLLGIVSDVLDFSKAESGKYEIISDEFDTAEFLNSIINVTNMRIGDKPVDFIVDVNPSIPKTFYGDEVNIRKVFMNLLGNAEKFTEKGHVKLSVDYRWEGTGIVLNCSVEDTGIGIKEEDKEKLFSAFQQVDAKKNRRITGTGLGLAIFGQLVTLMHGTYGVDSIYGEGSRFFFEIPIEVRNKEPFADNAKRAETVVPKLTTFHLYGIGDKQEAGKEEKAEAKTTDYSSAKILIVDDNKVNVKVLAAFLKHFNIIADSANSGPEAIDRVKEKEYDLIFMDHMMPDMDGVETTQRIRAMEGDYYKKVPIVACTANVLKGVEDLFYQAGMNDFVPKPVQINVLSEKLKKYLGE